MKKPIWVPILLLLILFLIWFYGCRKQPVRGSGHLELGPVAHSVWDDGSLSLAIPIKNSGTRAAGAVQVNAVTLGGGTMVVGTTPPASLGEIISDRRSVLQTRFTGQTIPGSYTLTVSGSYTDNGARQPYNLSAGLTVAPQTKGPVATVQTTVPKRTTTGIPTRPSEISLEREDNNPVGPPVPLGIELKPFTVAPNETGAAQAPSSGMSVTFIRDTGNAQTTGVPPDPSTAVASKDGVVLSTVNRPCCTLRTTVRHSRQ